MQLLLAFNLLYVYFHSECNFITIRGSFRNKKSLQDSFLSNNDIEGFGEKTKKFF